MMVERFAATVGPDRRAGRLDCTRLQSIAIDCSRQTASRPAILETL